MYFTSNREKGTFFGGLDIYKSVKDTLGEWGPAVNLGPNINTEYNEETPFITKDGQTLFFSSYGHFNTGGYDILYSTLLDSVEWSKPLNMGYPINTPDDDVFYAPTEDGNFAYYSQFTNEGMGEKDIFLLEIFSEEHPRKFMLSGIVSIKDIKWKMDESFRVYVVSRPAGDTIAVVKPNLETGEYFVEVIAGNYELVFSGTNLEETRELISMSANQENDKIQIPSVELIPMDLIADFEIPDTSFVITDNEPLILQLETENNSRLIVQYFQDSMLQKADTFYITDTLYAYKAIPLEGDNKLKFTLTDQFGNETIKETEISFNPPVEKPVADLVLLSQKEEPSDELIQPITKKTDSSSVFVTNALRNRDMLIAFKESLAKYAYGSLKEILDTLRVPGPEIQTSSQLFEYLSKQKDFQLLLHSIALNGNPEIKNLYNKLLIESDGELKSFLQTLNTEEMKISNAGDLIEYLLQKSSTEKFTREDVINMITKIVTGSQLDEEKIITYISSAKEKTRNARRRIAWGLSLVLVAVIIFYIQRKKKKKE